MNSSPPSSHFVSTTLCLLGIALLSFGCTSQNSSRNGDAGQYSEADLFEGLVLAQGEVAREIDPIRNHWMADNYLEDEQLRRVRAFTDTLVQRVSATNPEFLSTFKTAVTSGNRPRIQNALNRGAMVAANVTTGMEKVQEARRQLQQNPDQQAEIIERFREEEGVREESAQQLEEELKRFVEGELHPREIPKPLNVDYAYMCYLHRQSSVWHIQNFLRDYAVLLNVDFDRQSFLVLPQRPPPGATNQDQSLLQEEMIDGIARKLES